MMRSLLSIVFALVASTQAYWLMGIGTTFPQPLSPFSLNILYATENFITTERMDPIVNPGKVSGHVHSGTPHSYLPSALCRLATYSSRRSLV
jgi:hypothetical protein